MTDKKITTQIKCRNIAPLEDLSRDIKSSSLKIGVFANNGSGKTFLSRMFRLTENTGELSWDGGGKCPTDKFLTFGENKADFSFQITDKDGIPVEGFKIELVRGVLPTIPSTKYLYHTFNQDYIDRNIRALDYDKDGEIEGYILGKANIDLKDDEEKLENVKVKGEQIANDVRTKIGEFIDAKIAGIPNIRRLTEYRLLTYESLLSGIEDTESDEQKSLNTLIGDFDKIKSVPEGLENVPEVVLLNIDEDYLREINEFLLKPITVSSLAEEFKIKVKGKQTFVEYGLNLISSADDKSSCPFCEQKLNDIASNLIDLYSKYINDSEAQAIKILEKHRKELQSYKTDLVTVENALSKQTSTFDKYKTKYIPSIEGVELSLINLEYLNGLLDALMKAVDQKISSIELPVDMASSGLIIEDILNAKDDINRVIDSNNQQTAALNNKKNRIADENKAIRKKICKAAYHELLEKHRPDLREILELRKQWKQLDNSIKEKKAKQKVSKKSQVASTIKTVLNYFFSDKYQLDEDSFSLVFKKNKLEKTQAKDVLSEGEKNIVAFAYYMGDAHLRVENESDYNKLFFIIDDPISSMDFTHVYTMCGVIRDIKRILSKMKRERLIVFTHNNDFMRVLSSNNIVDKKLLLKSGKLQDFNNNLTVPYIHHLIDVYQVARKGYLPNHTTANSIRHIVETLTKFQHIDISKDSIASYIKTHIPDDTKSYTLINDLSHGGWRSEQMPIRDEEYIDVCEIVITHLEGRFPEQVSYCQKLCG